MAGRPSAGDGGVLVSEWNIALGALVLLLSLSAGALLSRLIATGTHRAPRVLEERVTFEDLVRPTVHGVNDLAWCPAEETETLHAFDGDSRTCWTCRTTTLTAVPRG